MGRHIGDVYRYKNEEERLSGVKAKNITYYQKNKEKLCRGYKFKRLIKRVESKLLLCNVTSPGRCK